MTYNPKTDWQLSDTVMPADMNRIEQGIADVDSSINVNLNSLSEKLSLYYSGKDSNGIFTTLEWKRSDATLAKKSVLSGGTSPKYTARTVTFYAADGATLLETKEYTLTYDGDKLLSEV